MSAATGHVRLTVAIAISALVAAGAGGCRCGRAPAPEPSRSAPPPEAVAGAPATPAPAGAEAPPASPFAQAERAARPATSAGEPAGPAVLGGTPPAPAVEPAVPAPTPPDTTPPATPAELAAVAADDRRVELRWARATDDVGVAAYEILRDGQVIFVGPGLAGEETGLEPARTYCYAVRAVDAAGNASLLQGPACATTPDLRAPSVPGQLLAEARSDREVSLRWGASTDDVALDAYEVVRDGATVATTAGLEATEAGLRPGTRHCYAVRARDRAGNRSALGAPACATTADVTPPTSPGRPVARAVSESKVEIAWEAASDDVGVAGYEVERDGAVRRRTEERSAVDDGLRAAVQYCWHVRARDAAGNRSPPAGPACATTPDQTPPTPPRKLVAVAAGETRVDVRWQPASDNVGVAGYEVTRDGAPVARSEATRLADGGLRPWTEHCYAVTALDRAGNRSALAGPACARTRDDTPPSAPGRVEANVAGPDRIDLRWAPAQDAGGVAAYRLRRDAAQVQTVPGPAATEAGLRPGVTYCWAVSAVDGAGNRSRETEPACAAIPDVTPPSPPAAPSASAISETEILLAWTASTDDNRVERYEVLAAGGAVVAGPTAPSALVARLRAGTEHCFTIRARDPAGNTSAESGPACATTPDRTPPEAPPGLAASAASDTELRLRWKPARDNVATVGYEVTRDGKLLRTQVETALSDPGLKVGTRHCYEVRALDAAGNGSAPAGPACATTPDLRPPTAPARVEAAPSGGKIAVGWSASLDDVGVVSYEVLRAGKLVATVAETDYREGGLDPKRWCYTVRALDAAGNRSPESAPPACATAPDVMPPSPPSRLKAARVVEMQADLRWTDSTDNVGVAGYELVRENVVVASVPGPSASDPSLSPAREYCWTVRAFDASGNRSQASEPLCVKTPDETPPVLPGPLALVAEVEDTIELRWAKATDNVGVVAYDVLRDGTPLSARAEPGHRDTGRRAGTRHCYEVRARDAAGHHSAPLAGCITTPDLTPPTAPADLEAAPTATEVALRWTEAQDNVGVAVYEVLRGEEVVARVPGAVSVEGRLLPRTEHCYRVRARDAAGNRSPIAGPVCTTTLDPAQPPAPRDVAVARTDEGLAVRWSASPRKNVVYRIYAGNESIGATRYLTFAVRARGVRASCFHVTALDEKGQESPKSKEVCLAAAGPSAAASGQGGPR